MKLFSQKKLLDQFNIMNTLKVSLYILPISLILGNAAVNINCLIITLNIILIFFQKKNYSNLIKKYF